MPQLSRGRMVCRAYTRDLAFSTGKTSRSDGGGGADTLARMHQASHDLCIGLRSHGYDAAVPLTRRFWGQHTRNVPRTTVSDLRTNGSLVPDPRMHELWSQDSRQVATSPWTALNFDS